MVRADRELNTGIRKVCSEQGEFLICCDSLELEIQVG